MKELEYGQGEAKGWLAEESATISGNVIKSQPFILVYSEKDFDGLAADGILGMSFPWLSDNYPPLVIEMYKQGVIESPIFSVFLSDNEFGNNPSEKIKSSVMFGG